MFVFHAQFSSPVLFNKIEWLSHVREIRNLPAEFVANQLSEGK